MKRKRVLNDVLIARRQTFGSTERDDSIDRVQFMHQLSSAQLGALCKRTGGFTHIPIGPVDYVTR